MFFTSAVIDSEMLLVRVYWPEWLRRYATSRKDAGSKLHLGVRDQKRRLKTTDLDNNDG
jgi:hypothetical protein